jgi:hypothetical protein
MMRFAILTSFFGLIFFLPLTLKGQDKTFEYQVLTVFTQQIDQSYSEASQIGSGAGLGVYSRYTLGKLRLETSILYLSHRSQLYGRRNTYGSLSLNGKLNFLFKTISMGERQVYLGPDLGIYQPLNSEGGLLWSKFWFQYGFLVSPFF